MPRMSLLVVGLSHRSAPVSVLERAALTEDAQAKLLQDTLAAEPATEAAVLATCNRIELYADVDKFHAGVAELSTLLAAAQRRRPRRAHPAPLRALRGPRRPPPVLGGLRPGLDGRRRGADPRPDQGRPRASARSCTPPAGCSTTCSSRRCGSASAPTARPASTGPASRWSPSAWTSSPAPPAPARGQAGPGRRRRLDVLAGRRHPGARRGRRDSSSPTAPPSAPSGSPPRSPGGHARRARSP